VHDAYAARAQADAQRFVRIAADAPMDSVRQAVLNALRERGLLAEELT
jgi:thymidylate kinase